MARQVQVLVLLCIVTLSGGYWTRWFDQHQESFGENESLIRLHKHFPNLVCNNPSAIDVKTSNGTPAHKTGERFRQYDAKGFVCLHEQQDDGICENYTVRFCCPGKTGATECLTDEELNEYKVMQNFTISINEDLEIGSTIFVISEFQLASSNASLHIVHGNQFNRFGVSEDGKSIVVMSLMDVGITANFNLVILVKAQNMQTMELSLHLNVNDVEGWPPYYNETCATPVYEDPMSRNLLFDITVDEESMRDELLSPKDYNRVDTNTNNSKCILEFSFVVVGSEMILYVSPTKRVNWYDVTFEVISLDSSKFVEFFKIDGIGRNATHISVQRLTENGTDVTKSHFVDKFSTYTFKLAVNVFSAPPLTKFRLNANFGNHYPLLEVGIVQLKITGCPLNKFGVFCEYDCHCLNGATCHGWNGACKCAQGWQGPTCDIPMEPYAILSVVTTDVRFYSSLRLQCLYYNIERNPLLFELNGESLSEDDAVIWLSDPGMSAFLIINNMTKALEGTYRCKVYSTDDNIFAVSNAVDVSIQGCQSGVWGQQCEYRCNCVHHINCDRYNGCICESGWEGSTCEQDLGNQKVYEIKSWETIIALIAFLVLFVIITMSLFVLKMRKTKRQYTPLLPERIHIPDGVTVFKKSQITKGNLIGEGEFSSVYSGCLRRKGLVTRVALKILKDNTVHNPAYQHEISTLNLLQGCPRIVKLMGVSMEEGEKSIVTELMSTDMHTLLRTHNVENISVAFGSRLQKFCLHVAEALQYMEKIKVVHRDIAARNVLISHDDMAKIGDFGLARDVYETLVYQRHPSQHHFKVPIRWMSPESLRESIYTHSSDMWSFGVFMWEIAALGDMPYHNMDTTQLVERLKDGYRLPKPQHCSDNFYNVMRRCWRWDPTERVTATMAADVLNAYTKENTGVFA